MFRSSNLKAVYLLWHVHVLNEDECEHDEKLLGVYSSRKTARKKIEKYKQLPGFRDHPDGFVIDRYPIDQDYWAEGFVTVYAGADEEAPSGPDPAEPKYLNDPFKEA